MNGEQVTPSTAGARKHALARRLTLPYAVLFGLGVTIGAGIYVLIGAAAGRAGMNAPVAFILAAILMAPTAASFAELACRMPVSAGEASYVRFGLASDKLGRLVGMLVVCVAVIAAAAISQGSAGYVRALFPGLPGSLAIPLVVLLTGLIAIWGIVQSMVIAGLMTLIEIGGLVLIIVVGVQQTPDLWTRIPEAWQGLSGFGGAAGAAGAWNGVLAAMLLAFFAFIGFEGLANIAEEVKRPERVLPLAILITLVVTTLLYVAVSWVALMSVPRAELAAAKAPLSLVFERVTGMHPLAISVISIVATVNGIIAQMVMASRVLYGLAEQGLMPAALGRVHGVTHTPIIATLAVMVIVFALAATVPIVRLAEMTSVLTLVVFTFVNAALFQLKRRGVEAPAGAFTVPMAVPATGAVLCVTLLIVELLR